jgi:hypothetical protein
VSKLMKLVLDLTAHRTKQHALLEARRTREPGRRKTSSGFVPAVNHPRNVLAVVSARSGILQLTEVSGGKLSRQSSISSIPITLSSLPTRGPCSAQADKTPKAT